MKPAEEQRRAMLLGLGLDGRDGHLRMTRGENFHLLGGSEETHECMQEKAVKFNEQLTKRKKELYEITPEEFHDIAGEVGMSRPE